MVAALLDAGGLDPTVINGGIINAYGTNARLGEGDWMVVEADESDGTFLKLPADVAVVTNIDPEHLDHLRHLRRRQGRLPRLRREHPVLRLRGDVHRPPEVQALVGRIEDRRIVTYGGTRRPTCASWTSTQGGGRSVSTSLIRDRRPGMRIELEDLVPADAGPAQRAQRHGGDRGRARARDRRRGDPQGALGRSAASSAASPRPAAWNGVAIFDDYGHHPVEIAAVLKAARAATEGQVIAVVQPHRYTRLSSLFDEFCTCFNDADTVIVAPVYAAGEQPIEGADRDSLVRGLKARGHRNAIALERSEDLAGLVRGLARPGDFVVCLGAGNITQWAYALAGELAGMEKAA